MSSVTRGARAAIHSASGSATVLRPTRAVEAAGSPQRHPDRPVCSADRRLGHHAQSRGFPPDPSTRGVLRGRPTVYPVRGRGLHQPARDHRRRSPVAAGAGLRRAAPAGGRGPWDPGAPDLRPPDRADGRVSRGQRDLDPRPRLRDGSGPPGPRSLRALLTGVHLSAARGAGRDQYASVSTVAQNRAQELRCPSPRCRTQAPPGPCADRWCRRGAARARGRTRDAMHPPSGSGSVCSVSAEIPPHSRPSDP